MGDLRRLGADLERELDPPRFADVHVRVRKIRRRRAAILTVVSAVVVLLVVTGLTRDPHADRSLPPVAPAQSLDPDGARRVLADPDAALDIDRSRVDGTGAMLAVVRRSSVTKDPCGQRGTALRWSGHGASTRSWLDVPRKIAPLRSGFVVGASRCGGVDHPAYIVDAKGVPHPIHWLGHAGPLCATHPRNTRCSFDAHARTGALVEVTLPAGAHLLANHTGRTLWATSADERRLWWSTDGRTWAHHDAPLPVGSFTSASAAGRYGVLASGTTLEVTHDGGATWHRRDLSGPLSAIRVGDLDWTVLPDGNLLGETQLVGRGDVLFRSSDRSWTRFVTTPVRTRFGLVHPTVQGDVVYVVDQEQYAVSLDGGAHWHRTPPLP